MKPPGATGGNRAQRAYPVYSLVAAAIITLTAAGKLYSALGRSKVLDIPEALLPMSIRQALWLVGIIELLVAAYVWFGKSDFTKLVLTAWLGGNFILYRIAALLLVVGKPCPCLGSVTEKIPLKPATIDHILAGIAVYLFAGSVLLLLMMRKTAMRGTSSTPMNGAVSGSNLQSAA